MNIMSLYSSYVFFFLSFVCVCVDTPGAVHVHIHSLRYNNYTDHLSGTKIIDFVYILSSYDEIKAGIIQGTAPPGCPNCFHYSLARAHRQSHSGVAFGASRRRPMM